MDKISIRCPYCAAKLYVRNAYRGSHNCELCRRYFHIDTFDGITISTDLSKVHDEYFIEKASLRLKVNSNKLGAPYWAARVFGTCGALVFLSQLSTVVSLFNIRILVSNYGWGHVPSYRLSYLGWLDATVLTVSLISATLSAIAFLRFMYQARKIGELERIISYRWSWRWTVISLFVPFWNIVRPWLGFAEIHKGWKYASNLRNRDVLPSDLPFSWHTLFLVITLTISGTTGRIYAEHIKSWESIDISSHGEFMNYLTPLIISAIVDTAAYFVSFIVAMAYLQSILEDIQDHQHETLHHIALGSPIKNEKSGAMRRIAKKAGTTFVGIAAIIVYAGMSIVQFFAIVAGITYSFHVPRIVAIIIASLLSWFPLIGSILGVLGAIYAWGWTWYGAVVLFFWYYVLIAIIMGVAAIMGLLFTRR